LAPRRSRLLKWLAPLLLAALLAVSQSIWMPALGRFLVRAGEPCRADIIVVLAGDSYGHRILKGGELVRQGFASQALVSGPQGNYGYHECDLAIPFAARHGYPAEWFIRFPNAANSTREEAQVVMEELRRRNVRGFLLVTSDYHTRRAGGIFRALARGMEVHVVAARDEHFRADRWWQTRPGRKAFAFEWLKTLSDWVGL
jgi:uncharacterized SAM-binding protein YcdF (DUF218 family)